MKVLLLTVIVAVTIQAVLADVCSPSNVPASIPKQPIQIEARLEQYPKTIANAEVVLSGFFEVIDGCNVKLANFSYYPPLTKTYLYGSKGDNPDDPKTMGFKISRTPVNGANQASQSFVLDANKNFSDFNYIKLFSEDTNLVIGLIKLYSTGNGSGGSSSNNSANESGSGATLPKDIGLITMLGVLGGSIVALFV